MVESADFGVSPAVDTIEVDGTEVDGEPLIGPADSGTLLTLTVVTVGVFSMGDSREQLALNQEFLSVFAVSDGVEIISLLFSDVEEKRHVLLVLLSRLFFATFPNSTNSFLSAWEFNLATKVRVT